MINGYPWFQIASNGQNFDRLGIFKHWGVLLGDELSDKNPMNAPEMRVQTEEIKGELEVQNDIEPTKK